MNSIAKLLLAVTSLTLTACGGAASAPPKTPPADTITSGKGEKAGSASAPLKGSYRIVTGSDGTTVVSFADALKRQGAVGEFVITFEEDGTTTLGVWTASRKRREEAPGRSLDTLCRARAMLGVAWNDKTMTLADDFAVSGWSDAVISEKTQKGNSTKKSKAGSKSACSFQLKKGNYRFTQKGDAALVMEQLGEKVGTFELEASRPVQDVDINGVSDGFDESEATAGAH